jgi:PAS domain S-box-containing protein
MMSTFITYVIEMEQTNSDIQRNYQQLTTQHELLLNSLDEGVVGIDLDHKISFCNPSGAEMIGFPPEELIGRTPQESFLIHPTDQESQFHAALDDGKTRQVDTGLFYTKQRSSFPVEYIYKAIKKNDNIIGGVVSFRDVSEQKRAHELAIKSEKLSLAGQLAAGIAHEIRNPLTSVKGFLQLIKSGTVHEKYIDIMSDELNKVEIILSELLMLAKPQAVTYRPYDIGNVMIDVITLLKKQALLNNTNLLFSSSNQKVIVNCDQVQMKQVFINFIKNSIEALPTGGRIEITLRQENDKAVIDIADNGHGIPEDKLKQVGQPFYTTKDKGTGLGLMVSFNIIDNHQGMVSLKSKVNKGTRFTITLPVQNK